MASSDFPWFVKPSEGYYCVVPDSFCVALDRQVVANTLYSKHSEMPIVHSVAKILAQMPKRSLYCAPECYVWIRLDVWHDVCLPVAHYCIHIGFHVRVQHGLHWGSRLTVSGLLPKPWVGGCCLVVPFEIYVECCDLPAVHNRTWYGFPTVINAVWR